MNPNIRGSSSSDEPTIICSLRHCRAPVSRVPAWLQVLIVIMFVVVGVWVLNQAFIAEDNREDLREQEHAEMALRQR